MPPRKKNNGWSTRKRKKQTKAPVKKAATAPQVQEPTGESLASFPLEIRRMIMQEFEDDPVSSICLGITCKDFMQLHRELHPRPVRPSSFTVNSKGCPRLLSYLLMNWMPQGLAFNWERGRYASLETQKKQGDRYAKNRIEMDESFAEVVARDLDRIATRKRDRRRYGHLKDQDEWSALSAFSDEFPDDGFYEPSIGNSSGTTEHSRGFWLRDEQRENARLGLDYDGPERDSWGDPIIDMHATWDTSDDDNDDY